jgi:hypothetical protein
MSIFSERMSRATLVRALRAKSKEASSIPHDLDWREWDFGREKLNDEELAACHAHEYGREIARRCHYMMTQLKILWRANELPAKHRRTIDLSGLSLSNPKAPPKIKRHPDRIRGDEAVSKLWMSGIRAETLSQRGFEKLTWYSLTDDCRKHAVQSMRNTSRLGEGHTLPSVWFAPMWEPQDSLLRPQIQFLEKVQAATDSRVAMLDYGFFAIDWTCDFDALKKQVCGWLKQQHAERIKRRPSRGQMRDQLRWLGALRVKEHYGRRNLVKSNFRNVRVEAPYKKLPDLYANAKKALKIIETRIKNGTETLSS